MKTFKTANGNQVECERETKTLQLKSVANTDYYKGKNHDAFTFRDGSNVYIYDASLNADMTEYDSNFAKELAFAEGKYVKITAYFVPTDDDNRFYIYNPRLLNVED